MLVTCEYVPSTFASSIEVHLPSAEPVQENAALKSFKKAVSKACKQKFQQHGIPVAEKRFKVNVPLGGSWGSLPTQPIRVTGASNKARAHALRTIPVFSTKSCSETCFVTLQEGMSPVKQVLQENHVKPAAPSGSAQRFLPGLLHISRRLIRSSQSKKISTHSRPKKLSGRLKRSRG